MKKKFLITFFLVLFSIFPISGKATWQMLKKGISYQKLEIQVEQRKVSLHTVLVDPKILDLKPLYQNNEAEAFSLFSKSKALAAINANFFDEQGIPLGLVKKDNQILHPIKKISWWSLFCLKNKKASIVHSKEALPGQCEQAVQAGPRLLVNGVVPKLKDESSRKTALGIRKDGQVILAVSEGNLPINELAILFKNPEEKGGLNCVNALNLDGGSSSKLRVSVGEFKKNISSFAVTPVALGVFDRE